MLEECIHSCLRRAFLGGGSWWVALLIDDFISCRESVLGVKNIHKTGEGRRNLLYCLSFSVQFSPLCLPQTPGIGTKICILVPLSKTSSSAKENSDTKLCFSPFKNPLSNFTTQKWKHFSHLKQFCDNFGCSFKKGIFIHLFNRYLLIDAV